MFRISPRLTRPVLFGTLAASLTAVAAVAGTIHTFAVTQTTGSEGATTFLQTAAGSALQGEVSTGPSTGLGTPFGVYGKYDPPSTSTYGIGIVGISTYGWGVVGSSQSGYPALEAFPNTKDGIGLDTQSDNRESIFAASNDNFDGADIYSYGTGALGSGGDGVYTYSSKGVGLLAEGGGGDGIQGFSDDNTNGVYGQSTSGDGVQGYSVSGDGVHADVSNTFSGVAGINEASGNGVYGRSLTGSGVSAISEASPAPIPTGGPYEYAALYSQSSSGPGVYGVDIHDTGTGVGYGSGYNRYAGVFGFANDGVGVYGYSFSDFGMMAENDNSLPTLVVEHDKSTGDEILAGSGGTGNGSPVGFNYAVDSSGNEYVGGTVTTGAGSFAISRNPNTDTVSYGAESTEPTVEDVGSAQLVNGAAAVSLAGDFRQRIQDASRYMVFLTPYGDNKGLYVASRTPAGFVVREAQGGRSTLAFDYRIVAQRYGVQTGRLPHLATISPRIATLHFANVHAFASGSRVTSLGKYPMAKAPTPEGSKTAALAARAVHAAAAQHRLRTLPPPLPAGFLAALHR